MPLTDAKVRNAKGADKPYKLADSGGLYLFVTPTGFRSWRMKYRFAGKERRLTFGPYPEISLLAARDMRDEARRHLRSDRDPGIAKVKARAAAQVSAATTLEAVGRRWHEAMRPRWSAVHADKVIQRLEANLFPALGSIPIAEIDPPMMLAALRKIERRGVVEMAHRVRQSASAIFVHAISEGIASSDPAAVVTKALRPIPKKQPQPALLTIDAARSVLSAAEASTADAVTKLCSRFIALTSVRVATATGMEWSEVTGIDWDDERYGPDLPTWTVPARRMKLDKDRKDEAAFDFIVTLSNEAVAVLRTARRLSGASPLVFPSYRNGRRALSGNTINSLYQRVGYAGKHVPHGWRATMSTVMNEWTKRHGQDDDRMVIDLMLAHVPKGVSGSERAYNRAAYLNRRRQLSQIWAGLLMDGMAPPDAIIDIVDHAALAGA